MSSKNNVEESIASAILNNPELIRGPVILETRWFGKYRGMIEAMKKVAASGVVIDAFSVSDEIGGIDALSFVCYTQTQAFGSKHNYAHYVSLLRGYFESEQVQKAITDASECIATGGDAKEALSALISTSMQLISQDGKKFDYNAKESLRNFVEKLEETLDAQDSGGIGLNLGIGGIDNELGGMQPSDLIVVGARPSVGKTSFAVSVMRNIAKRGKKVGIFSTEMSNYQLISRFVSIEANISGQVLRSAILKPEEYARLTPATSMINGFNIQIFDKPEITINELCMQARAWAADGLVDFIAIDYLTRINPNKEFGNKNIEVGFIITELKNLARTLNIPVMVLAQLNRQASNRKDKFPVMSDLRDSGIIEQEADQILLLHREDYFAQVIIEKNRHGACGVVKCEFEPTTMHWRDFSSQWN
ncbi:MAG: DnaB-like helicase C-terminal domain-containing protein [Methylococcaceae bacterium]|jgi:replicative DNA helicase